MNWFLYHFSLFTYSLSKLKKSLYLFLIFRLFILPCSQHKQLRLSDRQHFFHSRLPPFNLLKPRTQKINKLEFFSLPILYPLCWIMFQLWTTNNVKWWWKLFTLSFWKLFSLCAGVRFCFDSQRLCRFTISLQFKRVDSSSLLRIIG